MRQESTVSLSKSEGKPKQNEGAINVGTTLRRLLVSVVLEAVRLLL